LESNGGKIEQIDGWGEESFNGNHGIENRLIKAAAFTIRLQCDALASSASPSKNADDAH
jgi:hypothetical protein